MSFDDGIPHYRASAASVAAWIRAVGLHKLWTVDGDPYLTERLSFPCFGEELADFLSHEKRDLLVMATKDLSNADGRPVGVEELRREIKTDHTGDHVGVFCWEGDGEPMWLLIEDTDTTATALDAMKEGR